MTVIQKPEAVDLSRFGDGNELPDALYGLPWNVDFCTRCVISNQRPNSTVEHTHTRQSRKETVVFDENGVCAACQVAEDKAQIDWEERKRALGALCDRFRSRNGKYDCVVPGSGGKDSMYASHMLKYEYGMHPLTVTWAPHIYTPWGWENFQAWIHGGYDNMLFTPDGRTHRLLTRLSVENLFHPFQPFILGQKNLGPTMSALHNIPLVFYGENEAEYGNPVIDNAKALRDWSYFTVTDKSQVFFGGVSLAELIHRFGVEEYSLQAYMPADPVELERVGTEVHYLGYYLRWHPQSVYYHCVEHGGFIPSPERTPGTYSKYNSIDDRLDDFHYYTTWIKFGIGRATYDAAQEIRSGDITRDEGMALVRRYDGEFPERFAEEVFRYLSIPPEDFPAASACFEQPIMNREYFERLVDSFRSPHLWRHADGKWFPRSTVWQDG